MSSKQELFRTIEVQKDQLARYESRLKDLVRAYKSLNKEKEALEASLKALSTNKPKQASKSPTKGNEEECCSDGSVKEEAGDASLASQLATVTSSLQTLLQEKTRMENNFMADRKVMKSDLDKTQAELKDVKKTLTETGGQLATLLQQKEEQTTQYNNSLRASEEALRREREAARQLESRCADLESELSQRQTSDADMAQLRRSAETWQARLAELEQTLSDREVRTCSLESHIAELSASLGRYQQQAVADQALTDRLKEQIYRLEEAASSRQQQDVADGEVISNDLDVTRLVALLAERIKQQQPVSPHTLAPIREILADGDDIDWKQECSQLKEEFEKYKVRAMAARKKDPSADGAASEVARLTRQLEDLRLRLRKTCEERDHLESTLRSQVSRLQQSEADLRLSHRSELAAAEAAHRLQLSELEQQLAGQRQRTAALLQERDAELERMRETAAADTAALAQIGLGKQEGQMLHYTQELARKDKEISNLRRTKHQLETSMRQLQNKMIEREEVLQDETERLRQQITRLEQNASREGANLEYVKNVVVRYLTCSDAAQRAHILNAIGTALHFSPEELRRVRQREAGTWWPGGQRAEPAAQHTGRPADRT